MKHKPLLTLIALAAAGIAAAAAPKIDGARIDVLLKQMTEMAPEGAGEPPADIRAQIEKSLAADEVLKAEALKAGLDKQPEVRARWQNAEARFYADQYADHLAATVTVDDAELRAAYAEQTRAVKLQQVGFPTEAEALAAQQLLLKGLSFEKLMERYPNPAQAQLAKPVALAELPPELAAAAAPMQRGEVSRKPVPFQGGFYLLKIAAVEQAADAPPFDQLKDQIAALLKQRKTQEKIAALLKEHGIKM